MLIHSLVHFASVSYSEHFSNSQGKYGPLHAESLQQQNLVSTMKHTHSIQSMYNIAIFQYTF